MDFDFNNYFDWLMGWEGTVYENDPDDPGGATKFGVDQRSHPDVNIRTLTRDGAKQIYLAHYWMPVGADKLPPRTAWAVVDCAVNCGPVRAVRWLQGCLGVDADGRVGPVTLAAAAKARRRPDGRWRDQLDTELACRVLIRRGDYYQLLGRNARRRKFLKGWLNRNEDLKAKLQSQPATLP
jgi:lysozyme family protein